MRKPGSKCGNPGSFRCGTPVLDAETRLQVRKPFLGVETLTNMRKVDWGRILGRNWNKSCHSQSPLLTKCGFQERALYFDDPGPHNTLIIKVDNKHPDKQTSDVANANSVKWIQILPDTDPQPWRKPCSIHALQYPCSALGTQWEIFFLHFS
jgi:hypothetical protein